ncbi:hypothetical protein GCM10027425_28560 [Alteromonas gracilis]
MLAAVTALALGSVAAPAAATGTDNQGVHVLTVRDGGTDVRALQLLLRARGHAAPLTGRFDADTRAQVVAFQRSRGLRADGVVAAAEWVRLRFDLRQGAGGPGTRAAYAVRALQVQLRVKTGARVVVDGTFGPATRAAVLAFQRDHGIRRTGAVGPTTWTRLLGHFEPAVGPSTCLYGSEAGAAESWGTANAVHGLLLAAAAVRERHGRVAVGDLSYEHGGDTPQHRSHRVGLDVDLRPMAVGGRQCSTPSSWQSSAYSRAGTRALVRALRSTGRVRLVYFNDPVLIREGLVRPYVGHDNHLHVRFSEDGVGPYYDR